MSYHFVALLVLTLVGQANPTTSDPKLVRVYVFTEAGETAEIAALRESVKDVSARLAGKKKTVVIVPSQTSPRSFRKITSSNPAANPARAKS